MSAESGWLAIAAGVAVGIFAWVVELGKVLWPEHPQWALCLVVIAVTIVSTLIFALNHGSSTNRLQS